MKDKIYIKFKKITNMSYLELLRWSKNECSYKASLDRTPIKRNLILLSKRQSEWTDTDYINAKRTISFISRMKKVKAGKPVCGKLSKRTIALKNWAYDPNK